MDVTPVAENSDGDLEAVDDASYNQFYWAEPSTLVAISMIYAQIKKVCRMFVKTRADAPIQSGPLNGSG